MVPTAPHDVQDCLCDPRAARAEVATGTASAYRPTSHRSRRLIVQRDALTEAFRVDRQPALDTCAPSLVAVSG